MSETDNPGSHESTTFVGSPNVDRQSNPDSTPAPAADPAPTPAPDFAAMKEALPDDLKGEPGLAPFTSLEGMARSLVEAQRLVGKRVEDMTPEQIAKVRKNFGAPDDAGGYELARPENLPDGFEYNEALEKQAREWFHQAGLNNKQAATIYDEFMEYTSQQFADIQRAAASAKDEAEKVLRREWSQAFDKNVNLAKRAVARFGGQELQKFLDETQLGNDPRVIRAFDKVARKVGEDTLEGEGSGRLGGLMPEEAKAEIAKIMAGPAYFDPKHPEHAGSVAEVERLFKQAHPEGDTI